jgi:hypothetical protein
MNKILFISLTLILLILLILLTYYLFKTKENYINKISNLNNVPIDVVYTWVDSYDPERDYYKDKLLLKTDFNRDKSRYEQSEELKYSIKSIEKNCPWVRNIYIVVKDDQKPNFINFDIDLPSQGASNNNTNKIPIQLIKHSMIMPASSLPTFSSISIELCLHNIAGLSDYYIYMNDDLFITKPLLKTDFIKESSEARFYKGKEGKPIVNITPSNKQNNDTTNKNYSFNIMYNKTLLLANKLTNQDLYIYPSHIPSICYKPWDKEIEMLLKTVPFKNTNLWYYSVHEKFRTNDSIALNGCFRPIYYIFKGSNKTDYYNLSSAVYLKEDNKCNNYTIFNNKDIFLCVNEIEDKCKAFFNNEMLKRF